jgi:hypothetical protein
MAGGPAGTEFANGVTLARAIDRLGLDPRTLCPAVGTAPAMLADAWGRLHDAQIRRVAGSLPLGRGHAPTAVALAQAVWSQLTLVPPLCGETATAQRMLAWPPRTLFLFLQRLATAHLALMNRTGMPVVIRNRLWELRSAEAMRLLNETTDAAPRPRHTVAEPARYWLEFDWCLESPLGPTRFFEAFGVRLAAASVAAEPRDVYRTIALRMPCETGDFLFTCLERCATSPLPQVAGLAEELMTEIDGSAPARSGVGPDER